MSVAPARRFFQQSCSGFVTSSPKQNFEKLVLVNHFPHEAAFRHKTLWRKGMCAVQAFFSAVTSGCFKSPSTIVVTMVPIIRAAK